MLVRRFFQNDLKPTAYVNATMRIIIVILLVWVLDPLLPDSLGQAERSAIAFAIGVFPAIGWQALQSIVAVLLKRAVPSLESKDPLSELDGMNVWYEARLVEEGIEGVQNLATADIGNALLRTRIPPERLIDWIDQALLRMHARKDDVEQMGRYGIHKATDLLDELAYRAPGIERQDVRLGDRRAPQHRCGPEERQAERNARHRGRAPGRAEPEAHPRLALLHAGAGPEGTAASEARAGRSGARRERRRRPRSAGRARAADVPG